MNHKSSGTWGVAALIGAGLLGLVLRKALPSLGSILLWSAAIGGGLLLLLVGVVIYFAFAKDEKKEADSDISLSKGRAKLTEIRRLSMRIKEKEIKVRNEAICASVDQIFVTLRDHPEDLPRMRQLFTYYLPTWGNILQKYIRLEESGVMDPRMTESMVLCLGDIQTAMDKLYRNLFEDDAIDLAVEMEVLTMVAKRDGLM